MNIDFKTEWESHRDQFCRLIQIPSVYEESSVSPSLPYGQPVNEALQYMRKCCEAEGLAVRDYDGYAISASWGGNSRRIYSQEEHFQSENAQGENAQGENSTNKMGKRIDIASHLDVVQVEDDWDENPFSGSVHDGSVWGRGTQDMKSGAFLTYLALKLIKDHWGELSEEPYPKNEIRLVYGTDEERTMDDMRYYVREAGLPDFAFTPDGHFPMTTGEKGALMWIMEGVYDGGIVSLSAGLQPNIIPPTAEAVVKVNSADGSVESYRDKVASMMERLGIVGRVDVVDSCEELLCIHVDGTAAHASRPKDGHSALSDLLKLLADLLNEPIVSRLAQAFGDPYGVGLGMNFDIPPMGPLTLNPGVMTMENGRFHSMIDCRYPQVEAEKLTEILAKFFPEFRVGLPYNDIPTLVDEDDPYMIAMKEAYQETLGKECRSQIAGGVSYCKVFGHCVTFGTVSEEQPSIAHQKNEHISEQDCIEALEIYFRTILKLLNL